MAQPLREFRGSVGGLSSIKTTPSSTSYIEQKLNKVALSDEKLSITSVFKKCVDSQGKRLLTDENIDQLFKMRYLNSPKLIIDLVDLRQAPRLEDEDEKERRLKDHKTQNTVILEICGLINQNSGNFQRVIDTLSIVDSPENLIFGTYRTQKMRDIIQIGENIARSKNSSGSLTELSVPCGKCQSKFAYVLQKQTRGADEPMTTYFTCKGCRHSWHT